MSSNARNWLIAIIILIILGLGYFAYRERETSQSNSTATTTVATTTTADITGSSSISAIIAAASSSGYTIKPIYAGSSGTAPTAPNYQTPLAFSSSVPADQRAALESQFAQTVAAIKANNLEFNSWISLGDERKDAGDYAGAAADWQYMSELYPTNIVSFANLADLYTNFLPNYPQAVVNYKAAIANNPKSAYLYDDLYQLYTHQYPQSSATITALLNQGIAATGGDSTLKADLATYQSSQ